MVKKVTVRTTTFTARDGKVFKYANAAKRYERGLMLGEELDNMNVSDDVREYLRENWGEIQDMNDKYGTVKPNEKVRDARTCTIKEKNVIGKAITPENRKKRAS